MTTITADTATKLKLYRCTSVPGEWPHRRSMWAGVRVTWLTYARQEPLADWRELLDGDYDDPYAQSLADELFTADEAEALARYLKTAHGEEVTITEEPLPMVTRGQDGGLMGVSAIPLGGPADSYRLDRHDDYDLPIKISGYYNMEQDPAPIRVKSLVKCPHHGDEWVDVPHEPYWTPQSYPQAVLDGTEPPY